MHPPRRTRARRLAAALATAAALAGCEVGHLPAATAATPTYGRDAAPLLAARCGGCHRAGGIGPLSLATYADVVPQRAAMRAAIAAGSMPPWLPADGCSDYRDGYGLAGDERQTLLAWLDAGAPQGAAAAAAPPPPAAAAPRADLTLSMPQPYLPDSGTDDVRCFVIAWPETAVKFVTGYAAEPGNAAIVHHVNAYVAAAAQAGGLAGLDGADGRPGFPCLGLAGEGSVRWLAAWVPGSAGGLLGADGTVGTRLTPGDAVVLQVHYHSHLGGFLGVAADRSALHLQLADAVAREGRMVALSDPSWQSGPSALRIPAGDADAAFSYAVDPNLYAAPGGGALAIYAVGGHMHLFGRSLSLARRGPQQGDAQCLLDVPAWDFRWQDTYALARPLPLAATQRLEMACHFDNGGAAQEVVLGSKQAPRDVVWGPGAGAEMCVTAVYLAPP